MNNYCITLIFILSFISASFAANCYGPSSKLAVVEFDAFPSPVAPGGTLYIRANIKPGYEIKSGKVQVSVYYSDNFDVSSLSPIINVVGLDLCTLSSKVTCPINASTTIFEWEFLVPNILPGTYQVRYTIIEDSPPDGNAYSCVQFPINVAGERMETYNSWYQATLLGVAVFDHEDPMERQTGHSVQVGPFGPLNATAPGYGSIKNLAGSGEFVPNPYYDTSSFIWGLSGIMTNSIRGAKNRVTHVYQGRWYLGYKNPFYPSTTYDKENALIEGDFNITWVYSANTAAQVSGYITFDDTATIPTGWGFPLVFGRIPRHELVTSDSGILLIKASQTYCNSGVCRAANPNNGDDGNKGLSGSKLGLAIGLPIAVVFSLLLLVALFLHMKRRRESEAEDGVFAVARKPEYGSALVVDDIIQETRGSKTLQSILDINNEYSDDGSNNDSDSESSRSRSNSRSRSVTRSYSHSRSISRSSRNGLRSAEDSDPGESRSRGSDSE